MFVITVIPIKRGFGEVISYFSGKRVIPGSVIQVPLRSGSVYALVLNCEGAKTYKAELRSSDFALRKIENVKSAPFFSQPFMNAVKRFAEFYATSPGEVLAKLVPKIVLENISLLSNPLEDAHQGKGKVELIQGTDEERMDHYKQIIKAELTKKRSVFLCLSTEEEIERAKLSFPNSVVFRAKMSKLALLKNWRIATSKPSLIIGTPNFLFLPMSDMGTIILDNEASDTWKTFHRPFVDFRKFVALFAVEAGLRLTQGDLCLSVETLFHHKPDNFSIESKIESEIVKVEKEIISHKIFESISKSGRSFVYSTRKGLSSMTVCRDCGEQVTCNNCGSPVVLYKKDKENIFRCHQCGATRSAAERCKRCNSWRLLPLGVGVEKVKEEIKKRLKDVEIYEINKEATPTSQKARAVADKFYKSKKGVLIGTEMALNFLYKPVEFVAIASIDSLFAIPNFRIREKIFHTILEMRSKATNKFIVQIRNTERETVELALAGNILDFYKREIKEREELDYPPYSVFIKVTVRGTKNFVEKEMAHLEEIIKNWNLVLPHSILPSSSEKLGAQYAMNCIIKMSRDSWFTPRSGSVVGPNPKLVSLLRSLPPHYEIKIDADNLL
jgi:primosomal protein N' (replication factor Y) (superfamily II helicase)